MLSLALLWASALPGRPAARAVWTPTDNTFYLMPAEATVPVGNVFAVQVMIETGTQPIDSFQFILDFNPAFLQVVDAAGQPVTTIDQGTTFDNGIVIRNVVDNSAGRVRYAEISFDDSPFGTLLAASFWLKAVAETSATTVDFSEAITAWDGEPVPTAASGAFIVIAASTTATPTATPTFAPTSTPSATPLPSATATGTPTTTPTATSGATATPTRTSTATATATASATATATATQSPTATASLTPTPTGAPPGSQQYMPLVWKGVSRLPRAFLPLIRR